MHKIHPHETGKFISIDSDGNGYYAYLPALLINKNISDLTPNKTFTNEVNGRNFIKYPPGTALMQTPFFTGALIYSKLHYIHMDGSEFSFQIAVLIASLFYLLLGLWFTFNLLINFGLKENSAFFAITIIFLTTNLLYYSLFKASMSHVYSFCSIAGFAYYAQNYSLKKQFKWFLLAAISLALVVLIRPFNLIVLLIVPLFIGSYEDFKSQFRIIAQNPKWFLIAGFAATVLLSIQPILWYFQTDHWILWSYKNEGFYFLKPELFNVLFSFKRGLLTYSPVLLLSIPGLFILNKQNRWQFLWLSGFLLLLAYLVSCWWNWYYGDGFGHRAFIDYYVLFAFLIALLFDKCKSSVRFIIILFAIAATVLNLVQTYQYRVGILHPHSMNADKYKFIFLKTSSVFIHTLGGNEDIVPYSKTAPKLYKTVNNDFETAQNNWEVSNRVLSSNSKGLKNHVVQFQGNEFGLKLNLPFDTKISGCQKLWATVSLSRLDPIPGSSMQTLLVIEKRNTVGENLYYYTFPINDIPSQKAEQLDTFNYNFEMPCFNNENEFYSIYLWNKNKGHFEIDDFTISIYRIE